MTAAVGKLKSDQATLARCMFTGDDKKTDKILFIPPPSSRELFDATQTRAKPKCDAWFS